MKDSDIIEQFSDDPENGYRQLIDKYTPIILRMIRRFMQDDDEIMEVYTGVCERLRSNQFQALRRFTARSELTAWIGVVVANACRDRFRKTTASSKPNSVIKKLDPLERQVFDYYYRRGVASHEAIAEMVTTEDGVACTSVAVGRALARIDSLLSANKRWNLISALNGNRSALSIDELREAGFQPADPDSDETIEDQIRQREDVRLLNDAIAALEPEDQRLIMLRYEYGMTAIEIAEAMRYDNYKYVYTRLRTIVNRLRRHFDEA